MNNRFNFYTITLILLLGILLSFWLAWPKTVKEIPASIFAISVQYQDVKTATDHARPNDIVFVPKGEAVWPSTLEITKPMSLIGSGTNETKIILGDVNGPAFSFNLSFWESDELEGTSVISNFYFESTNSNTGIFTNYVHDWGNLESYTLLTNKLTNGVITSNHITTHGMESSGRSIDIMDFFRWKLFLLERRVERLDNLAKEARAETQHHKMVAQRLMILIAAMGVFIIVQTILNRRRL